MAAPETSTATALHPLAIINISDYYTRAVSQRSDITTGEPFVRFRCDASTDDLTTVIGLLLGSLNGRDGTIETSFELVWQDGVDRDFLATRLAQCESFLSLHPLNTAG